MFIGISTFFNVLLYKTILKHKELLPSNYFILKIKLACSKPKKLLLLNLLEILMEY